MTKLKLEKLIIFQSELAFDSDGILDNDGFEVSEPKGFSDNEAIKLLKKYNINRIQIDITEATTEKRINQVHELLESEGITYYK